MGGVRNIAVLGATGSIGASALDVIARHPGRLRATLLAAGSQVDALLALCRTHQPAHAVIADESCYPALRQGLSDAGLNTQAHAGSAALDGLSSRMTPLRDPADPLVAAVAAAPAPASP